ncbi:peptidylprolyl isomerase [Salinivibrio sp. MA351]|jgi:FKBP-type peptidyl-prolyl cis-trans isomerase SlpA|uniref:FKBP-type peptidyl-prolyl cis-trans isomerase n=1 Tax=Salinivibrio TaxID=51366 RepID=UPI00039555CF|nr:MULTISPECIES: FKBP-type peptidyl-prolyl cis-trans isomerase [Salinivibrio]OOE92205.1 peptidylprolyl isomerase [Salinivibrio sp. AR640]OOE97250.1 peptidylprolyl isomerase [Salinivibrio sp. MA351]OOE97929.1 peptidylprolyl isomerase [Salinivibrio sp. IB643]OOF02947.1 peptidylprolyl isomerase [Salinivibrio sp. MA440]OOF04549.1 peptidylprolyl isomerase [Salinivibrio sp. MA607]
MKAISAASEVIMHFTIKLEDGSVADTTHNAGKPAKLVMGDGSLTENFENCLLGLKEGASSSFTLAPEDAFGQPNPDNIHHMDRRHFGGETPAEEGAIIAFSGPQGQEIPGIITAVSGDSVTVDFNHPLAGKTVIFDVEIISVQ